MMNKLETDDDLMDIHHLFGRNVFGWIYILKWKKKDESKRVLGLLSVISFFRIKNKHMAVICWVLLYFEMVWIWNHFLYFCPFLFNRALWRSLMELKCEGLWIFFKFKWPIIAQFYIKFIIYFMEIIILNYLLSYYINRDIWRTLII